MHMNLKRHLEHLPLLDFLVAVREAFGLLRPELMVRAIRGTDKRLISDYFNRTVVRRLHIGADKNVLAGWLNTDFDLRTGGSIFLDAKAPFPFAAASFDYVFSEHMIEHISPASQLSMLRECFRVLKPGGWIRISTPNLKFLVNLYGENKSSLQEKYVSEAIASIPFARKDVGDVFVINNYVRAWGHTFIHDARSLAYFMCEAGFADLKSCSVGESDDPNLAGLENVGRMPPGFLELETTTLEGRIPLPRAAPGSTLP